MASSRVIVQGQSNRHAKAKRFICYDFYVDEYQDLKVEPDVVLVSRFVSQHTLLVSMPTKERKCAMKYQMPGNRCLKKKFQLITDICKRVILSAVQSVMENMKDGNCFEAFDTTNFVVTPSGKVLFQHIPNVALDYNSKRRTLANLCDFIHNLFGSNYPLEEEDHIPKDVQHLIGLLRAQKKEVLYNIHSLLTPHSERGWSFTLMYEHVKFEIPTVQREDILLRLPYITIWRTIVFKNTVLLETYTFKQDIYVNGNATNTRAYWVQEAEFMLDFVRNAIAHHLQKKYKAAAFEHETILIG